MHRTVTHSVNLRLGRVTKLELMKSINYLVRNYTKFVWESRCLRAGESPTRDRFRPVAARQQFHACPHFDTMLHSNKFTRCNDYSLKFRNRKLENYTLSLQFCVCIFVWVTRNWECVNQVLPLKFKCFLQTWNVFTSSHVNLVIIRRISPFDKQPY